MDEKVSKEILQLDTFNALNRIKDVKSCYIIVNSFDLCRYIIVEWLEKNKAKILIKKFLTGQGVRF